MYYNVSINGKLKSNNFTQISYQVMHKYTEKGIDNKNKTVRVKNIYCLNTVTV